MPTRKRLDQFVEAVVGGRFVEALRDFYHVDAVTQENNDPERRGRETLIAIEEQVLRAFTMRTQPPGRILLDGDEVAIQWTFDITDPRGVTRRMQEVALQHWRGDRIERERFFYDPSLPPVDVGVEE